MKYIFLYTEHCHLVFQQVLGIPGFLFDLDIDSLSGLR